MKRVLYITKRLLLIGLLVISFGMVASEVQASQTLTGAQLKSGHTGPAVDPSVAPPTKTSSPTVTKTEVKPGPTVAGTSLSNGGKLFKNFQCSSGVIVFECTVGGVFDASNKYDQLCACCGECQLSSFLRLANQIMRLILGIAGSLALMMFVFGGAMIVGSGGNSSRVQKGKSILTNAVLGVIIVLLAYSAVSLFLSFFRLSPDQLINKSGLNQVQSNAFKRATILTPDDPKAQSANTGSKTSTSQKTTTPKKK
jgi:hypothetical protein